MTRSHAIESAGGAQVVARRRFRLSGRSSKSCVNRCRDRDGSGNARTGVQRLGEPTASPAFARTTATRCRPRVV